MSKRKSAKLPVHLTKRTLRDLASVEEYSFANWGIRVARRYLDEIEAALPRISKNPEVLRKESNFHEYLFFYRVNQHLLVCEVQPDSVIVLTVLHANLDDPDRLAQFEPTLSLEVELLHQQLERSRKKSR